MEYFDTHAHYDDERFDEDREDIINKIYLAGVTKCINMGCDLETSKKAIKIANSHSFIYAMCGIHPEAIPQSEEELWKTVSKIKDLASNNKKVIGIGEIGLDYHWKDDNKDLQKKAFEAQIEIANELGLPISIHSRDAIDDTINIIRKIKVKKGGVLHCCPFNSELVRHGLDAGLSIGFGGTCTFKNSKNAVEMINLVPNDRILIETDSPYLAPEPVRGTRNTPANVRFVAQKIADAKSLTLEDVEKITSENIKNVLFK